jgi:hypothetical protein
MREFFKQLPLYAPGNSYFGLEIRNFRCGRHGGRTRGRTCGRTRGRAPTEEMDTLNFLKLEAVRQLFYVGKQHIVANQQLIHAVQQH